MLKTRPRVHPAYSPIFLQLARPGPSARLTPSVVPNRDISPHYFRKIHICFYARIYLSAALRHIYLGNAYLLLCVRSLQKIAIFIFLYIQWIYERDVEDILVYEIDISLRLALERI